MRAVLEPRTVGAGRPVPPLTSWSTPSGSFRLLSGPPLERGHETHAEHRARLGRRPRGGAWVLEILERSGLRGRGGAWFPTARKWAAVRALGELEPAVVVVNLSEGEPLSAKDRTLALHRPHLVLDGAQIAAESIGADEVLLYVARPAHALAGVLRRALAEREGRGRSEVRTRLVRTPHRYVAGESSAVVRRANGGPAKPTFGPPHPSERGVGGSPTLVQNAETLAHAALIARGGDAWYRERGTEDAPGTTLVTVSGGVRRPGVYEIDLGTPLVQAIDLAGGAADTVSGALVGGYFGTWCDAAKAARIRLSPEHISLGCGVLGILDAQACGLVEATRIVAYLSRESAGQCGPCVHGLAAVAETMERIAASDVDRGDLDRLQRWTLMIKGRGACHHPDGAVANVRSVLEAFADHLPIHLAGIPCSGLDRCALPPPPRRRRRWR
jgi:NADH:ubiquinone oxidoreductase subunit F (NADH-binding)